MKGMENYYPKVKVTNGVDFMFLKTIVRKQDNNGLWREIYVEDKTKPQNGMSETDKLNFLNRFHENVFRIRESHIVTDRDEVSEFQCSDKERYI